MLVLVMYIAAKNRLSTDVCDISYMIYSNLFAAVKILMSTNFANIEMFLNVVSAILLYDILNT